MAITRDQLSGLAATGGATSLTVTWGTNPTAGAKVLVFFLVSSTTTITVADNGTTPTTFTLDASDTNRSNKVYLYRADGITLPSAGSYAVTITCGASRIITAGGVSYLGVRTGAPTATNSGDNTGNGPVSTGSVTPSRAGALYFAVFADTLASGTDTISLTNGSFTEQFTETNATSFVTGGAADFINSGVPAAEAGTWTINSGVVDWAGVIAAYDIPGAASAGLLMASFL